MSCELPEFFEERAYTAQKEHRCCECRKPIKTGERYAYICMKLDGVLFTEKQHERCYHFARHVNHELEYADPYDGCIGFGEIEEALRDSNEISYDDNDNLVTGELGALWLRVKDGFEFRPDPNSKAEKYYNVFAETKVDRT